MAAFKVGDIRTFHLLGTQEWAPQTAIQFLTTLLGKEKAGWWFELFLTGGGLKLGKNENRGDVMRQLGLAEANEPSAQHRSLAGWDAGWGQGSSSRFVEIHDKIEQIYQWR